MKREKNVDFVRKSEKTNCYLKDVNWPNIDKSVSVANTYLGNGSPGLATVGVSDKYFKMNDYPGVNIVANSTDLFLGQSTIRTSVLSDNKHWLNLNESVSPANTYWGVGSPQLGTIGASVNFFNRNIYPGLISVANSTDLTLGQSNFGTSLLSDMRHWSNIVGSVSGGNTSLRIGSSQLETVSVFDEYSKKRIISNVKPTGYLTDFDLSQSVEKASLIVDNKDLPRLVGSSSIGNAYISGGLTELATVSTFDRYSNKSIYSVGNPTVYLSDYSLGKSVVKASLHSDGKYRTSLAGALSVGNTYMGVGLTELPTVSKLDRYSPKCIYSVGNPTGY